MIPSPSHTSPHGDAGSTPPSERHRHAPSFDPRNPPPRVTRAMGSAVILAQVGMQVSPRTLETWPVPTRMVNGRATFDTAELIAHASHRLQESADVRGGRRGRPSARHREPA